jgi:hypothetical protein
MISLWYKKCFNVVRIVLVQRQSSCGIGDKCQFYAKNIGMTLDDILRDEIRLNMTLNNQSISVKISGALTMILFAAGLVNSILSFLTFYNKDLRKVGCGMYLLASSITSLPQLVCSRSNFGFSFSLKSMCMLVSLFFRAAVSLLSLCLNFLYIWTRGSMPV